MILSADQANRARDAILAIDRCAVRDTAQALAAGS
jgi:hypothetical protein